MHKKILIIVLAIFLIGNFHVVTDWCDDLPTDSVLIKLSDQTQGHNAESDLCGHCGHLGLNVLQIAASEFNIFLHVEESTPFETVFNFDSNLTSPPTPPPLYQS